MQPRRWRAHSVMGLVGGGGGSGGNRGSPGGGWWVVLDNGQVTIHS